VPGWQDTGGLAALIRYFRHRLRIALPRYEVDQLNGPSVILSCVGQAHTHRFTVSNLVPVSNDTVDRVFDLALRRHFKIFSPSRVEVPYKTKNLGHIRVLKPAHLTINVCCKMRMPLPLSVIGIDLRDRRLEIARNEL